MFDTLASKITSFTGSPKAFILASTTVLIWLVLGPIFHWSEMHSLFINTLTTIITFLMAFLLQFSQSKDTKALHLKLDALIKAIEDVDNKYLSVEDLTIDKIEELKKEL